ncbi:MAG TPA: YetF domain-containing protein [Thermoanaerobaculia bacterium]|nr:YetF domain-containing protein [Thermoanaerobaculia bacterium]
MEEIRQAFGIGEDPRTLDLLQLSLRAVAVYLAGWFILRVGGNRFLGRETAFDIVLAFVLGSTLSRAINGSGPLHWTILGCAVLVALHHLLAWATFRSHRLGLFFKGSPEPLIRDGRVLPDSLRKHRLSQGDLEEALRLHASVKDLGQIEEARYERNGDISFVKKSKREPKVVEIQVENGVQTVRIEIG